jgi:hypothetical protein
VRQLAAAPGNDLTPSHPEQQLGVSRLLPRQPHSRLKPAEQAQVRLQHPRGRLSTLHELTKLDPVPIIADALGYHPSTIERHAIGSASMYAESSAAARELKQTS